MVGILRLLRIRINKYELEILPTETATETNVSLISTAWQTYFALWNSISLSHGSCFLRDSLRYWLRPFASLEAIGEQCMGQRRESEPLTSRWRDRLKVIHASWVMITQIFQMVHIVGAENKDSTTILAIEG